MVFCVVVCGLWWFVVFSATCNGSFVNHNIYVCELQGNKFSCITVDILKFQTPKIPIQTAQTKIRLVLKEQSDQDLPCYSDKHFVNYSP